MEIDNLIMSFSLWRPRDLSIWQNVNPIRETLYSDVHCHFILPAEYIAMVGCSVVRNNNDTFKMSVTFAFRLAKRNSNKPCLI